MMAFLCIKANSIFCLDVINFPLTPFLFLSIIFQAIVLFIHLHVCIIGFSPMTSYP